MQTDFNTTWNKWISLQQPIDINNIDYINIVDKSRSNLDRIGQLAKNEFKGFKLAFKNDGDIDTAKDDAVRAAKGWVDYGISLVSNYKISDWNEDIHCLETFTKFLDDVFVNEVKPQDKTKLEQAINGLSALKETYTGQLNKGYTNKNENINIVDTAITSLRKLQEVAERKEIIEKIRNNIRKGCVIDIVDGKEVIDHENFTKRWNELKNVLNRFNKQELEVLSKKDWVVLEKLNKWIGILNYFKNQDLETLLNKSPDDPIIKGILIYTNEMNRSLVKYQDVLDEFKKEKEKKEEELGEIEKQLYDVGIVYSTIDNTQVNDNEVKKKIDDLKKKFVSLEKEIKYLNDLIEMKNAEILALLDMGKTEIKKFKAKLLEVSESNTKEKIDDHININTNIDINALYKKLTYLNKEGVAITPKNLKEANKAYRELVIFVHPDKAGNDTAAAAKLLEITEAIEIIRRLHGVT